MGSLIFTYCLFLCLFIYLYVYLFIYMFVYLYCLVCVQVRISICSWLSDKGGGCHYMEQPLRLLSHSCTGQHSNSWMSTHCSVLFYVFYHFLCERLNISLQNFNQFLQIISIYSGHKKWQSYFIIAPLHLVVQHIYVIF